MCGVFASTEPEGCLPVALEAARRGPHSWGVVLATGRGLQLHRSLGNPQTELPKALPELIAEHQPIAVLGHCRLATTGKISLDTCQPILCDGFAVAHNGILTDWDRQAPSDSFHLAQSIRGLATAKEDIEEVAKGQPYAVLVMSAAGLVSAFNDRLPLHSLGPHWCSSPCSNM